MKKYGLLMLVLCFGHLLSLAASVSDMPPAIDQSSTDTNAVLIFLDDSEKEEIDPITSGFFAAFIQEAAPIIVSASIVNNIRSAKPLEEKDFHTLFDALNIIRRKKEHTAEEKQLLKSSIVSSINFDQECVDKWIIKKINESLYLFVPKKYLQAKHLQAQDIQIFSPQGSLTHAEQALGLKVNHLETVAVTSITEPTSAPRFATYFIDALNNIFVARREYSPKVSIPNLSVFIHGHGMIKAKICDLSLEQFNVFLSFLEKLSTRILIYQSCYAAGLNTNIIYKDAAAAVAATYGFPIITIALTDVPTKAMTANIGIDKQGNLKPYIEENYDCFVTVITSPDIIDYSKAIHCIQPVLYEENIPQIRYPGLPWFSILDYDTVAPIGSVMAKTRTTPLNIAKFYAKQGKSAAPYALLLYAREIPFELIINTKRPDKEGGDCYVPLIVSMIPGSTVHFIKKISSACTTAGEIMANFYIKHLAFHKIFIIDEITAPCSARMGAALQNVIIDVNGDQYTSYFMYKDMVYVSHERDEADQGNGPAVATVEQENTYRALLAKYSKENILKKPEPTRLKNFTSATVAAIRAVQEKKIESVEKTQIPESVVQGTAVQQVPSTAGVQPTRKGRHRSSPCRNKKRIHKKTACRRKKRHS